MSEFVYEQDAALTASPGLTPSQTVGPFFHFALPYDAGPEVAGPDHPHGVSLSGQVLDGDSAPVPDALVEIWQADELGGFVSRPGIHSPVSVSEFRGFGRSETDAEGRYRFRTVKPGAVPTRDGRAQAPHIAMSVFARGMLRRVVTRVYFADETSANAGDPLLLAIEPERRATLLATRGDDGYVFDVRLQGDAETVFLDVFAR